MAFEQSTDDKRRVIIIDVSHLFYRFAFGGATHLSSTLQINGVYQEVDTTLPNYVTKTVHRWTVGGGYPVVVAFDGSGSAKSRKAYFRKLAASSGDVTSASSYKANRQSQNGAFYQGINLTRNLLQQGGVMCLQAEGYEADDLIKAAVDRAKEDYPNIPIDVFTGDADLLPLVDEQVSVWYYSKKGTYAEPGLKEVRSYIQVTPRNYKTIIEGLTACKNLKVPYNSILLTKLLRGDKSDEIPGYPKFTPTLYNKLIDSLIADGVDIANLFRYGSPIKLVLNKNTREPIPVEMIPNIPREMRVTQYLDPPELTNMLGVLKNYLTEDQLTHVRNVYNGINLNGAFTGLPDGFNRPPAKLTNHITGYDENALRQAVEVLKINLPIL